MKTYDAKQRIELLFFQARERVGEARAVFLDEIRVEDPELHAVVTGLLAADGAADSFFEQGPTAQPLPRIAEGVTIGRYKLLQQIGEGGFGIVYMAQQLRPVRRKVAFKVIKPGMDSREIIARFEAERQALAMMEHPNIARVLDGGTTDSGHPYFVMELVNGFTITQYCDDNQLAPETRLQLFIQVCRAIQHAHQKGIIHRDLKPSNVLVTLHDGVPVPKVIDFGVAKALNQELTEKTLFTRYGQFVGTPQYMSPEQAEMSGINVDVRSDIYSLGVLLYELITGSTPLDVGSLRETGVDAMRQMICSYEPLRPSTRVRTLENAKASTVAANRSTKPEVLSKWISGDLDWIAMKALEKDRNRRYDSANSLIRELERYLHHEPVEARPPTLSYQWAKLYRRNRLLVYVCGSIAAILIVGITLTTWAWLIAESERKAADAAKEESSQRAVRASREAERARESLAVLESLLSNAAPSSETGVGITVTEFLNRFATRIDAEEHSDRKVEIDVRLALATAFLNFSLFDEAVDQLDVSEQIGRSLYHKEPHLLARFLIRVADLNLKIRRQDVARRLLEEVLTLLGEEERVTKVGVLSRLSGATLRLPDISLEYARKACELTDALGETEKLELDENPFRRLADVLNMRDELDEVLIACERARDFARTYTPSAEYVSTLIQSSLVRRERTEYEFAAEYADQAVMEAKYASIEQLANALKARMDVEFYRTNRSDLREVSLRCKQDLEHYWDRIYVHRPVQLMGALCGAFHATGADAEADDLETKLSLFSPSEQELGYHRIATWLQHAGFHERADQYFAQSIRSTEPPTLWRRVRRARNLSAIRNFRGAIELIRAALQLSEGANGIYPWDTIAFRFQLALCLESIGETESAKQEYRKLSQDMPGRSKRLWGRQTPPVFAFAALKSGEHPDLDTSDLQNTLRTYEMVGTPYRASWALGHAAIGLKAEQQGDRNQAIEHFVEAVEHRPGTYALGPLEWINDQLVQWMTDAKQFERLEKVLRDDVSRRDAELLDIHPERAFVRLRLLQFLLDNDRELDAAPHLLDVARSVYEFHGEFLPADEWKKFRALEQQLAARLATPEVVP